MKTSENQGKVESNPDFKASVESKHADLTAITKELPNFKPETQKRENNSQR